MPYQETLLSAKSTITYQPANTDNGLLEEVIFLLNKYLPNTDKPVVLDTGALVGATAGAYNDAIGVIGNRSSRR